MLLGEGTRELSCGSLQSSEAAAVEGSAAILALQIRNHSLTHLLSFEEVLETEFLQLL